METNGKTVLVVEDDLFLRDILCQKLLKSGYAVEGAIDSEAAFKILEDKKIDLIILDLLLPGMSGQEILKKIKANSRWQGSPVIIASNLDSAEEKQNCMHLGAAEYMIKAQHTPDEIVERAREILAEEK